MATTIPALLGLADGSVFRGTSVGVAGVAVGEVVFNTSMTGYQEILTDPSYARQIVTLTYPHIGNTGTNNEDYESNQVWSESLVVRDVPNLRSNRRSRLSLREFLLRENVVAISDVDTRRLTRLIRSKGAQAGCVIAGDQCDVDEAIERARAFGGLSNMDLAQVVSCTSPTLWKQGDWHWEKGYSFRPKGKLRVVAYDFGIKRNILRLLVDRGCEMIVVPAQTPAQTALDYKPDGIFLSNGPGDPAPCTYAMEAIQKFFEVQIPLFGICLGFQLLALAGGAQTIKMKYGHHGANHPVRDLQWNNVAITSQNHGFCVETESLPEHFEVTHRSLFDDTLQGIHHRELPAFGFQGHPEASPGPQDCRHLFDHFVDLMNERKANLA